LNFDKEVCKNAKLGLGFAVFEYEVNELAVGATNVFIKYINGKHCSITFLSNPSLRAKLVVNLDAMLLSQEAHNKLIYN